jgi:hypothetical protein
MYLCPGEQTLEDRIHTVSLKKPRISEEEEG